MSSSLIQRWIIYGYVTITMVITMSTTQSLCRSNNRMSWCQDRNLHSIPSEIANDTVRLMIQDNHIINSPNLQYDLTRLSLLQSINFGNNNLSALPKGIAASISLLKVDHNSIRFVGMEPLKKLSKLKLLDLTSNLLTDSGFNVFSFEGTGNLETLILTDNNLRSIPEALPKSLTTLKLEKNEIDRVSVSPLKELVNLQILHLGFNQITNPSIEPQAFSSLISISELNLENNQLTDVPTNVPTDIRTLVMSHNRIRTIYGADSDTYGGVQRLTSLKLLDVSFNRLESVEPNALDECTHAVQLHDNPFRCDCYMKYLKGWLEQAKTTLSMEAEMRCFQPFEFREVTLNNIELEALQCPTRTHTDRYLKIDKVMWDSVRVSWRPPTADPGFVKRKVMYGTVIDCDSKPNCSDFSEHPDVPAQGLMQDVNYFPVPTSKLPTGHINFTIPHLKHERQYAICMFDSLQTSEDVRAHQCILTTTMPADFANGTQSDDDVMPPWVIITIACAVLIVTIATLIAWYSCRHRSHHGDDDGGHGTAGEIASRRKRAKQRDSQRYYAGTAADPYNVGSIPSQPYQMNNAGTGIPPQQQQAAQQQVRHPATLPPGFYDQTYDSHASDRTYAECGSYRSSMAPPLLNGGQSLIPGAYRSAPPRGHLVPPPGATAYRNHQQRDSAIDARKEFEGLLMTSSSTPASKMSTRHMVSPFQESLTSSDGPDTMSTYQTGTIGSRDTNVDDDNYLLPVTSPIPQHMLTSQSSALSTSTSHSGPYDHLIPHHTGTAMMMQLPPRRDYGNLLPAIPTSNNNNNEMYI